MKHPLHLPHLSDPVTRTKERVNRSMARMRQSEELLQDAKACVLAARLRLEGSRMQEAADLATNENPKTGKETR